MAYYPAVCILGDGYKYSTYIGPDGIEWTTFAAKWPRHEYEYECV